MSLPDEVRAHAARVAAGARAVRIDPERLAALTWPAEAPAPTLEHGVGGSEAEVAQHLLVADAVNFGSGWFPTLVKRRDPAGRPVS
ncbi:MAG: hypothetical protein JWO90_235, partial [Solirubrobacterales bacterium]|nr:hypothetical protein [Solirubrobacterales bacterium]